MATYPLCDRNGHFFIEIGGERWLFDTGSPASFGIRDQLELDGEVVAVDDNYFGLDARALSEFVNMECAGLLGADVLAAFDFVLDPVGPKIAVSTEALDASGVTIPLADFMGIPIVTCRVADTEYRFFFDTGAQISYLQDERVLTSFPSEGSMVDFYPGVGQFETSTYRVDLTLGSLEFSVRCGSLPGLLGATLMLAGTTGILGNEIVRDRKVGYFPRRRVLKL